MNWVILGLTLATVALATYWSYRDAKSRDANPILWAAAVAIAGIMLPPFGVAVALIFYALMRPKGRLRICPHCSKPYLESLAFCPNCGKPVKKECLRCHETIELDATECPYCRMKVS